MRSFLTSALVTGGGGNEGTARTQEGWEEGQRAQEALALRMEDYGEERDGSCLSVLIVCCAKIQK